MLIGSQYSDNKLYRGIKHYDTLPLTSGDLHEYADTSFMKNAYLMNNIIGYGTLNSPKVTISSQDGIQLGSPAVVLIDGDISLIQADEDSYIVSTSDMEEAGLTEGVVCIVGWYQHIDYTSTIRNYGGVENDPLENDLLNEKFNVQISTRYQFRWVPVLLSTSAVSGNSVSFSMKNRNSNGVLTSGTSTVTSKSKVDSVFIANAPTSMTSYAKSDLYIIPILKYKYNTSTDRIESASTYLPITPKGTSGFISSSSTPAGEYTDGTTWYNPITREFKTYVAGSGFISSSSKMGLLYFHSVVTLTNTQVTVPFNLSGIQVTENDILQVIYEGLTLTVSDNYTVDYTNQSISLVGFQATENDHITFTVTRIVEANDITNVTATFTSHMVQQSNASTSAHVKLSDTLSNSDASSGVAATPQLVKNSRIMTDSTTNHRYTLGVENGILYIEEV